MILTGLLALLVITAFPQANSWRNIVPLLSTREDVEKLLGAPTPESKAKDAAIYKTENEKVFVLYSTGSCEVKPSNGWNASRGTVITISVEPNRKVSFADLKLDDSNYEKRPDPEVVYVTSYINERDGISIDVNTDQGSVISFRYGPRAKDRHLRCSSEDDGSLEALGVTSHKVDEYSAMPLTSEMNRLDRFANQLVLYPTTQAYIIVNARTREYRDALKIGGRAKRYLVEKHHIQANRIKVIRSEQDHRITVELWLVPVGAVPPAPKDKA
jgi:hypothetical protein